MDRVSDEDAKKVYEQRKDKLDTPEKRKSADRVPERRRSPGRARARSRGGASFDDIAKERGLAAVRRRSRHDFQIRIIDPAVAEAAFALKAGEVSQPIQGKFGVALVKVGKIEPGNQPTYDSVAAKLKHDIAVDRARARQRPPQQDGGRARRRRQRSRAAKKLGLTAVTIDAVDRSGRTPDGKPVAGIPPGVDLIAQAFASDVGVDNETLQVRQ